jgi:hypothetical protein
MVDLMNKMIEKHEEALLQINDDVFRVQVAHEVKGEVKTRVSWTNEESI